MTTRRALTAAVLSVLLVACAGAPASRAVPTPQPLTVEGHYVFWGFVPGAGAVDGSISFDEDGTAMLATGAATCASRPRAYDGWIYLGCRGVSVRVEQDADSLLPTGKLTVAVQQVIDRPADAFDCRGDGAAGRDRSWPGCTANGMKRTIQTHAYTVAAELKR
ncbi:MAG TPA: hypothetical protein VEA99_17870, partial [Gemmatimonadaceae bacterium]|nr:hypothetical protein [Gemmatimonadaceae bacterium]